MIVWEINRVQNIENHKKVITFVYIICFVITNVNN